MSFLGKIRGFDVFKKMPMDLTEPTYSGAISMIQLILPQIHLFFSFHCLQYHSCVFNN
jgi:hypothetical protein